MADQSKKPGYRDHGGSTEDVEVLRQQLLLSAMLELGLESNMCKEQVLAKKAMKDRNSSVKKRRDHTRASSGNKTTYEISENFKKKKRTKFSKENSFTEIKDHDRSEKERVNKRRTLLRDNIIQLPCRMKDVAELPTLPRRNNKSLLSSNSGYGNPAEVALVVQGAQLLLPSENEPIVPGRKRKPTVSFGGNERICKEDMAKECSVLLSRCEPGMNLHDKKSRTPARKKPNRELGELECRELPTRTLRRRTSMLHPLEPTVEKLTRAVEISAESKGAEGNEMPATRKSRGAGKDVLTSKLGADRRVSTRKKTFCQALDLEFRPPPAQTLRSTETRSSSECVDGTLAQTTEDSADAGAATARKKTAKKVRLTVGETLSSKRDPNMKTSGRCCSVSLGFVEPSPRRLRPRKTLDSSECVDENLTQTTEDSADAAVTTARKKAANKARLTAGQTPIAKLAETRKPSAVWPARRSLACRAPASSGPRIPSRRTFPSTAVNAGTLATLAEASEESHTPLAAEQGPKLRATKGNETPAVGEDANRTEPTKRKRHRTMKAEKREKTVAAIESIEAPITCENIELFLAEKRQKLFSPCVTQEAKPTKRKCHLRMKVEKREKTEAAIESVEAPMTCENIELFPAEKREKLFGPYITQEAKPTKRKRFYQAFLLSLIASNKSAPVAGKNENQTAGARTKQGPFCERKKTKRMKKKKTHKPRAVIRKNRNAILVAARNAMLVAGENEKPSTPKPNMGRGGGANVHAANPAAEAAERHCQVPSRGRRRRKFRLYRSRRMKERKAKLQRQLEAEAAAN